MEILQFLLYFLLSEYGGETLSPLLESYKQVNYDIIAFIKSLDIKDIMPVVKLLLKGKEKKRTETERFSNFLPIKNIANDEILSNLEIILSST